MFYWWINCLSEIPIIPVYIYKYIYLLIYALFKYTTYTYIYIYMLYINIPHTYIYTYQINIIWSHHIDSLFKKYMISTFLLRPTEDHPGLFRGVTQHQYGARGTRHADWSHRGVAAWRMAVGGVLWSFVKGFQPTQMVIEPRKLRI